MNRKIVLAACKLYHEEHGELILSGHRHWSMDMHQTMDQLKKCGWGVMHEDGAQGFVDNGGKYYTREEAIQFVKDTGQFYDPQRGNHQDSIDDCDVLGEYEVFCSPRDTIEEAQADITTYLRSIKDKIVTDTDYVGYP